MKCILVVDDSIGIRALMQQILLDKGVSVTAAASGEEALEICKVDKFDVMFVDINMPGGMHGVDFCVKVREDDKDVVIYAITGYSSVFDITGYEVAGFNGCLLKPIDIDVIIKVVDEVIKND